MPNLQIRPCLLAAAIALATAPFVSHAQADSDAVAVAQAFNIPAGDLGETLSHIAHQTGDMLSVNPSLIAGKRAPAVQGQMSTAQAINQALAGSGLIFSTTASGAYTVLPGGAHDLPATTISGSQSSFTQDSISNDKGFVARRSTTATKTDTPLLETPQAISVVTREQMDNLGAQNLSSALRYSAGVSAGFYGDDPRYDWLTVRGFTMSQLGMFRDGLRSSNNGMFGRADSYGLERVEILKGPASVLYGQNAPGGMINIVTKRPSDEPFHEVQLGYGSFDNKQARLDLNDALNDSGTVLGRLTMNVRDSQAQIDHAVDDHVYVAPAITFRNDDTSLTVLASYQHDTSGWGTWLPAKGSLVRGPTGYLSHHFYGGDPDFNTFKRDQYSLGYLFEHRFNDTWLYRQNVRVDTGSYDAKAVRSLGWIDPDNSAVLFRDAGIYKLNSEVYSFDNQLQANFDTPGIEHTSLVGFDYTWQRSNNRQLSGPASPLDLNNPGAVTPTAKPTVPYQRVIDVEQIGAYAQHQVKIDDHWIARVGVRHDQAKTDVDVNNNGRKVGGNLDQGATTWQAGLLYLFDNGLAPYYSYAESFLPTTANSANGKPYKATTGTSHELGIKYQPPGSDLLLTAAVFDIVQKNMVTTDPIDTRIMIQTGEVESKGLELEGKYTPTPGLDLTASYTYLDARVTKDNTPGKEGTRFTDSWGTTNPRHSASAWADFTHQEGQLKGLGYGVGVRYVSGRPDYNDDYSQVRETPGYTLVDSMIHYQLDAHWNLQLNVDNVTNKSYIANNCYFLDTCYYGPQRTFLASARYRW